MNVLSSMWSPPGGSCLCPCRRLLPNLTVMGGGCGTDRRHVEAVADCCVAHSAACATVFPAFAAALGAPAFSDGTPALSLAAAALWVQPG